jgi:hypothetical protein
MERRGISALIEEATARQHSNIVCVSRNGPANGCHRSLSADKHEFDRRSRDVGVSINSSDLSRRRAAARRSKLNRGTRHTPMTAEHAAIARLGPQHLAATGALVEKNTRVRRHRLGRLMPAMRTRQDRFQNRSHDDVVSIHGDDFAAGACSTVFNCFSTSLANAAARKNGKPSRPMRSGS